MQIFHTLAVAAFGLIFYVFPSIGFSQTSLADLKEQMDANSRELDEIDAMLGDLDPNRRSAAMNLLLGSGNTEFVKRAIEVGLLSSDARMRAAALEKTLETGGTFTLDIDLTEKDEEETKIRGWLSRYGNGSWDDETKKGTTVFRLGEFDPKQKCWVALTAKRCALIVDGERVSLNRWDYSVGQFTLADDGTLKGTFGFNYSGESFPLPATIRLID